MRASQIVMSVWGEKDEDGGVRAEVAYPCQVKYDPRWHNQDLRALFPKKC